MSVLSLIAATLISLPQPDATPAERIMASPPRDAIRAQRSVASLLRVLIAPSGEVERCDSKTVVGEEDDGRHFCSVFRKLKFQSPVGADGQPSFGLYETLVKLSVSGARDDVSRLGETPQLVFAVRSLPANAGTRLDFEVLAEVTRDGKVSECAGDGDAPAEYALVACTSLEAEGWEVLKNEAGNPVPYVTRLKARFTTESTG